MVCGQQQRAFERAGPSHGMADAMLGHGNTGILTNLNSFHPFPIYPQSSLNELIVLIILYIFG